MGKVVSKSGLGRKERKGGTLRVWDSGLTAEVVEEELDVGGWEEVLLKPLDIATGSLYSSGFGATRICLSARSTGLGISSKLELSSSSSSASSLSAYFEVMFDIELACSFMDGGGVRIAGDG